MATEQDFRDLTERLSSARERLAVLLDREAAKTRERDDLVKRLTALGINTDNIDAELERLTQEIDAQYVQSKQVVDQFEEDLAKAEKGELKELAPGIKMGLDQAKVVETVQEAERVLPEKKMMEPNLADTLKQSLVTVPDAVVIEDDETDIEIN